MVSNISSDMNKPCWKLAKACPQSQKLFCFGENNLLIFLCVVFQKPKQADVKLKGPKYSFFIRQILTSITWLNSQSIQRGAYMAE